MKRKEVDGRGEEDKIYFGGGSGPPPKKNIRFSFSTSPLTFSFFFSFFSCIKAKKAFF